MGDLVRLDVGDGVASIRLDRPKMNAISDELVGELRQAAEEAAERDDVGAVVVWGGPRIFAAGADVKQMKSYTPAECRPFVARLGAVFTLIEEIPKVTFAAIEGYALGGGLELAMCADFRFAGESAKVGQPEILLGVIPGAGGTQRLTRLIGSSRAKDIIYSGRQVDAAEALRIGLVDRVVADGSVHEAALEEAARYAAGPRVALRAAKTAINWGARGGDVHAGLVLERELFADLFSTDDQKQGMESFLDRGPGKATFSGT